MDINCITDIKNSQRPSCKVWAILTEVLGRVALVIFSGPIALLDIQLVKHTPPFEVRIYCSVSTLITLSRHLADHIHFNTFSSGLKTEFLACALGNGVVRSWSMYYSFKPKIFYHPLNLMVSVSDQNLKSTP